MLNLFDVQAPLRQDVFPTDNQKPAVIHVRNFDEGSVATYCQQFQDAIQRRQPIIPINIDSFGGQIYALQPMISMIQNSPVPVATYTNSKAMSCGSFLLGFGTKGYRYMGPRATAMIHEVSCGGGGKVHEVKVSAEEGMRLNNELFEELALHCGWEKDHFLKEIHERKHADWLLKPEEAIYHKLVDHIAVPKMITRVRVETVIEIGSLKDCF